MNTKTKELDKFVTITLKHKIDLEEMTIEAFQNFPESGMCISCISYSYGDTDPTKFKFVFKDYEAEGEPEYVIDLEKAKNAMKKFIEEIWDGNYSVDHGSDIFDTGNWDAYTFDAVAQVACFGEVIYG